LDRENETETHATHLVGESLRPQSTGRPFVREPDGDPVSR
jgi:hypothetical protein